MFKNLKLRLICYLSAELYTELARKYVETKDFANKNDHTESHLLADAYAWQLVGLAKLRRGEKG